MATMKYFFYTRPYMDDCMKNYNSLFFFTRPYGLS